MAAAEKKEQKKALILTCAEELFARQSFHEVLMEDVARLAGIGKGTVYNYFSNKEELYSEIISNKLGNLLADLSKRVLNHDEPILNLRRLVIHTYSFMVKYADFFRIWNREKTNISNTIGSTSGVCLSNIKNLIRSVLEKGREEQVFKNDFTPEFLVDIIFGMIEAAVARGCQLPLEKQREDRNRLFLFIINSIATPEGLQTVHNSPELKGIRPYAHTS